MKIRITMIMVFLFEYSIGTNDTLCIDNSFECVMLRLNTKSYYNNFCKKESDSCDIIRWKIKFRDINLSDQWKWKDSLGNIHYCETDSSSCDERYTIVRKRNAPLDPFYNKETDSTCRDNSYKCVMQRLNNKSSYGYYCDIDTDSCDFIRNGKRTNDIFITVGWLDIVDNKDICDIFNCSIKKDSSFIAIINDTFITLYDKEYLLMRYPIDIKTSKQSQYIWQMVPNCKIKNYNGGVYSYNSECDLASLITSYSSKPKSIYFSDTLYEYILRNEFNITNKILKLKSEKINKQGFEKYTHNSYLTCISLLSLIKEKYNYDILYLYPYPINNKSFCDLDNWRGASLPRPPVRKGNSE